MPITVTTLVENTAGTPFTIGEWGQSLLVEADGQKILFDTGPTAMIAKNASALGVDIGSVDKIVLSHGHYDHTGGLQEVLTKILESGKHPDGIEIIAHPDIFTPKHFYIKDLVDKYVGIPFPREELEALGASFNLTNEPVKLSENMLTTGEVEITVDFEKIDKDLHVKEGESHVHDKLADDMGIIIKTDQGLVLLLGCAHRGIVNTLLHAQKVTGIKEIYAVIGGTHLISADKEQMQSTIQALKGFNIKKLGASHCTGLKSAVILAHEFEGSFFFNSAGTKTIL
ncbi:MAG: MBL fold metallo-hydrolase [Chloroflexi bacterium]|nr:MBL fold metallo-hydrolase [Chloroflexota bacterium]